MVELTGELAKSLVEQLEKAIPNVRVNSFYYLSLDAARKAVEKSTVAKRTYFPEEGENSLIFKSDLPINILGEVLVPLTLDSLEVFYGRPLAGFTVHKHGEAKLGYNKNKHTEKVVGILRGYNLSVSPTEL
jgi:hypothetical protein